MDTDALVLEFMQDYSGVLKGMAYHYANEANSAEDLYQQGLIFVLVAVKKYDPTKGHLNAMLTVWYKGGILNFLRDHGSYIKINRKDLLEMLAERMEWPTFEPIGIKRTTEGMFFQSDADMSFIGEFEDLEDRMDLNEAIKRLPERQQVVIHERFWNNKSQKETALISGTSQVQVSKDERKAISELRAILSEEYQEQVA